MNKNTLPYRLEPIGHISKDFFTNVVDARGRVILQGIPTPIAKQLVELSEIALKQPVD